MSIEGLLAWLDRASANTVGMAIGLLALVALNKLLDGLKQRKSERDDKDPRASGILSMTPPPKCGFNGVQQKTLEEIKDINLDHLKEVRDSRREEAERRGENKAVNDRLVRSLDGLERTIDRMIERSKRGTQQ